MEPSYAPLGPIVSIVPSSRRMSPVALAGGAVGLLFVGFLGLAIALLMRDGPRDPGEDDSPAASGAETSLAGVAGATDEAAPERAEPATEAAAPSPAGQPEPAASSASAPAEPPDEASEESPQPRRRAARRGRRGHGRRVARASRRAARSSRAAPAARAESSEPSRLVPRRSSSGGFGSSADVMRSLGL